MPRSHVQMNYNNHNISNVWRVMLMQVRHVGVAVTASVARTAGVETTARAQEKSAAVLLRDASVKLSATAVMSAV